MRAKLRTEKQLAAKEEKVLVFDPVGWTDAQKRLVAHYEPGLQLRFVKTTAQFKAGETVEVVGHIGKQLRVQCSDGRAVAFSPTRAPSSFEVGERREIGVAVGDVVLLRANASGFVNGERVQVRSIHEQRISLTDGRELPESYRTFTHGYAITSHAAQGKTVDEVLVVASSRSFAAVSQAQFYVSISRARERARIYTDDAELLGRRVEDTHTRKAAVELEGLHDALQRAGYTGTPTMPTESRRTTVEQTIGRVVRQMRQIRVDRLAPAQRFAQQMVHSLREWFAERLGAVREEAPRVTVRQSQMQQVVQRTNQSRGMKM